MMIEPEATPSFRTSGDGWTEHVSKEGRKYYFNELTQESQWGKPLSLQTPEEAQILLKTGWQEFFAADGKCYWFHGATKRSVWTIPREVEEMVKSMKEEREDWPQFSKKEEAKIFLIKLFDLKKFPPKISWENASKILESDRRWGCFSILTRGERKQTFAEYMSQRGKRAAEEDRQKRKKAKEYLLAALADWRELNHKTTYIDMADRLHFQEWWVWMPEGERDDLFQDWIADNEHRIKERAKRKRREDVAIIEEILEHNSTEFSFRKKWEDVKEALISHPKLGNVMKLDVLQVWEEWVRHGYSQERQLRHGQNFRKERLRRDAFRELLQEAIEKGELCHHSEWIPFVRGIESDQRYTLMVGQGGSTPRELFLDAVENLKVQHEKNRQILRKNAERAGLDWRDPSLPFDRFYETVRSYDEVKNISVLDAKMAFEAMRLHDSNKTFSVSDGKARSRSSRQDMADAAKSDHLSLVESNPRDRERDRGQRTDDGRSKKSHRSYQDREDSRHKGSDPRSPEPEQQRKRRNIEDDRRKRH